MSGGWGTPRRSVTPSSAIVDAVGLEVALEASGARPVCKHCGRRITDTVPASHVDGNYSGKQRCDPADSGRMYGFNAEPVGAPCVRPCLGAEGRDDG